jgi:hypothetical protein
VSDAASGPSPEPARDDGRARPRLEVPVVPEGSSLTLLSSGVVALMGWAALRRRGRGR